MLVQFRSFIYRVVRCQEILSVSGVYPLLDEQQNPKKTGAEIYESRLRLLLYMHDI